jgi:prepilin-type N-terminal cleavage/methylation domain-containing protein
MKNLRKTEQGLTLIEVLAVLVIGSIIILLIWSALQFGQKNYKIQSEKTEELFDVTYAMKVITKEIRKAESVKIDSKKTLTLNKGTSSEIIFKEENNLILKNGIPLANGNIEFIGLTAKKIRILISVVEKDHKSEKVETEITLRRGD